MEIHTLVTSVSKKVPLLRALRSAYAQIDAIGRLVGADSNPECVAKYFVDEFWPMPQLAELPIDSLIGFCKDHGITCVVPTRDGELAYFASHKALLRDHGIHCMVSDETVVEICLDKLLFYETLARMGYPAIPSSVQLSALDADHFVVKERYGAGAREIGINLTASEAHDHARNLAAPLFQPFVAGIEASVDVYVNQVGQALGAVARTRDLVVGGESQVTTTITNRDLEVMCSTLAEKLGVYGHVVFQVMIDPRGQFHVIECNPRYGGASTLSAAVGLQSFTWFLLEAANVSLHDYPFIRSPIEKKQVRYAEDLIL